MTLWSGRFSAEPDKEVFEYGKSLAVDKRLVDADITGSQAWAEALGRAGVLAADRSTTTAAVRAREARPATGPPAVPAPSRARRSWHHEYYKV